jgi:ribose transport system ATP-binding protein
VSDQQPVLHLEQITKAFSGVVVLNNVSIDLFPGEVHCLVGENGAGKSTLIKIISGAYQAEHGTITYVGETHRHLSPRWARENGINTIYQEIDLVPSLTAAENISLGNEPLRRGGGIDWEAVRQKARDIFADMGLQIDLDIPIGRMKVAHQQMVAIAKALSLQSKVIILDEPTAVFTRSEIDLLFRIIGRLKAQGKAILYISHHMDEIFEIGDRVTVLRDGNLIRTGEIGEFDKDMLVKAMVGRSIDFSKCNGTEENSGEELFRVEGLHRNGVVSGIDFCVHAGEIVGVAGLVGAGRTEMARCLIGADRPDSGTIFMHGKPVKTTSPKAALDLKIGMLPESRKEEGLVLVRPMGENIAYSMVEKINTAGVVPWSRIRKTIKSSITDLDIRPSRANIQARYMSGGNQQKVVLAKLLAAQCDFMIFDEPTRGVDVGARSAIYELMQKLKAEGKGILMISSDLPEILTQADRILVMAKGKIVGELSCKDATEEKVLSIALQLGEQNQ